jgi:subtilisin family serine protease
MSSFSNYGLEHVHIAAPGSLIISTVMAGAYDTFSGTSMACPHVSGLA